MMLSGRGGGYAFHPPLCRDGVIMRCGMRSALNADYTRFPRPIPTLYTDLLIIGKWIWIMDFQEKSRKSNNTVCCSFLFDAPLA